jgi:hypothetical protein
MASIPVQNELNNQAESPSPLRDSQTETATLPREDADEYLYLIGQPTLKQFLRFVKDRAIDSHHPGTLTEEWHAANAVVRSLEKEEIGIADNPAIDPVRPDDELKALPADITVEAIIPLTVPGLDAERHLIILKAGS